MAATKDHEDSSYLSDILLNYAYLYTQMRCHIEPGQQET